MVTALEELKSISLGLELSGIEDSAREAEIILTNVLNIDKKILYRDNPPLSSQQGEALREILHRRILREPYHYITGHIDFYGLSLAVGAGALIPRPETELVVEEAVKSAKSLCPSPPGCSLKILDLCTGSGCIALAVGHALPVAEVTGVDISPEAVGFALKNAERNLLRNVVFRLGDLYGPVEGEKFDLITSNPPYIKSGEIPDLQPEIVEWEPSVALDGGQDGMDFYRRIILASPLYLKKRGILVLELGYDLKDAVEEIARRAGYEELSFRKDYAGIDRVLCIRKS